MNKSTKAILVTANGCCRPVLIDDSSDIPKYIGCSLFDVVAIDDGTDILIDDSGFVNIRPINMIASLVATKRSGIAHVLAGDVLIVGHDGGGERIDCPEWVYESLSALDERTDSNNDSNKENRHESQR